MTHCGHDPHRRDDMGAAAEEFARRVARDASRFGERLAEHAGEFARHFSREWRAQRRHGLAWDPSDVRAVLRDVRTLLSDVVDGVDELIDRMLGREPTPGTPREDPPDAWVRVVAGRDATCAACGRHVGAGEECHLHRRPEGPEFRCRDCGAPPPPSGATGSV